MKLTNYAIFFILILFTTVTVDAQNSDTKKYYVTKTGKRYHFKSCHYLKNSKTVIKTNDKKFSFYTPCKVCKPPKYIKRHMSNIKTPVAQTSCTAITKAGSRCKRIPKSGHSKCWQHE